MKNVYDILVNFKKNPYEFYEWDKKDNIEHIKVISSFKISDRCLYDFINYDVKVDKEFLNKIYGKCQTFSNHLVEVIDYACILCSNFSCLVIEFNKEGYVIGKSKLLFDEEDDVVSSSFDMKVENIKYTVLKKANFKNNYTRKEMIVIKKIEKYLDDVFNKNQEDEIKYMYLECFNKAENDMKKAYYELKDNVLGINLEIIYKLKSLIKVLKK